MALSDAESLSSHIAYGVSHGMDIGDMGVLGRYNSECWMRNNRMLGAVDKLGKLYGVGSNIGAVVWARGVGLGMVDRMDWLKGWFMTQAGVEADRKGDVGGLDSAGMMQSAAGLAGSVQQVVKGRVARWLT